MAYSNDWRQVHSPFSPREMDEWLNFHWEGHVPGSGQLGIRMSDAFGLPHSLVTTVIKSLRSERVLSIKGRGSSAAQMTIADAGAIMVGIMSGAVSAEIPSITKRILRMPSRNFVRAPPSTEDQCSLEPSPHTFLDGFSALFQGGWDASRADERITGSRIMLGFDGHRTEGFAVLEATDHDGAPIKNFYSTCALRDGFSEGEDSPGLGLSLYLNPPRFVFSASVDGIALSALKRALADPVSAKSRGKSGRVGPAEDV